MIGVSALGSYGSLLNRNGFWETVPEIVYSTVCPSEGDLITSCAAMIVAAPGLFSTMTGTPRSAAMCGASARA